MLHEMVRHDHVVHYAQRLRHHPAEPFLLDEIRQRLRHVSRRAADDAFRPR